MMTLRAAPAALAARRRPARRLDRPWPELLRDLGFVELDRDERELVVGAIGRFWQLREELEPLADAEAFAAFDRAGFARGALNLRAEEAGEGSVLSTETRVWTPDRHARRRFAPYWLLVRAAGEPIRREILRAAARRA